VNLRTVKDEADDAAKRTTVVALHGAITANCPLCRGRWEIMVGLQDGTAAKRKALRTSLLEHLTDRYPDSDDWTEETARICPVAAGWEERKRVAYLEWLATTDGGTWVMHAPAGYGQHTDRYGLTRVWRERPGITQALERYRQPDGTPAWMALSDEDGRLATKHSPSIKVVEGWLDRRWNRA
jgi:hypothetical protein